jgi:YrhK-like protein
MAALFAGGSVCFVVASLPGFVQLVGSAVVGVVYFVGSLQFTVAAAIQWLGTIRRLGIDWWSSAIQFVGTLLFNLDTYDAMQEGLDANSYDRLVWTPDALGSVCFLVASYLAYAQATGGFLRRPRRGRESTIATVNLVGSVAFGIAAIASYWVPTSGSVLDLAAANGFTALGGLCFLAGALLLVPRNGGSSRSGDGPPAQSRLDSPHEPRPPDPRRVARGRFRGRRLRR